MIAPTLITDPEKRDFSELVLIRMTSNKLLRNIAIEELERRYKWSTSYEETQKLGRALGYSNRKMEKDMPRPQLLDSTVQAFMRNYKESPEKVLPVFDSDIQIKGQTENFRGDLEGRFGNDSYLGMIIPEKQNGAAFISRKALDILNKNQGELPEILTNPEDYTSLVLALKHQGFGVGLIDGIYLEKRK